MCGIFAVINQKDQSAEKVIFYGLKALEYRGYDSWGLAVSVVKGGLKLTREIGKIGNVPKVFIKSKSGIGHTRWATHGGVNQKNTHPHFDCKKEIFVVHNGIIENFLDLKKKLIEKKHKFRSETDTEIIAHLLEEEWNSLFLRKKLASKKKLIRGLIKVFSKVDGLNAFVIFLPRFDVLLAVKNSSPLVFGFDKANNQGFLASDYSAIVEHTPNLYFLGDYEYLLISSNGYELYDQFLNEKKVNFTEIKKNTLNLSLGKHPHYMIKEISEQPRVLSEIAKNEEKNIARLAKVIKNSYGNYFIGCGSAFYACLAGTYFFSKIAKRHTNASVASEFFYLADFLKPDSLVIALSQSGETIDVIASIKQAKEKKSKVFAITNVLGSTLYRLADFKMLLNAGPEKCVLATKSFTAKLAILFLLAHQLNQSISQGYKDLSLAVDEISSVLNRKSQIRKLAKFLVKSNNIFLLGRGLSYPLALESALKIKEVSYIHAEGFPAGELKHGVIALIEKNTPVIVYNPEDETYKDTLSSAYEVKARGAYLIGLSSKEDPIFDHFFRIKYCRDATIIPSVVFSQLLGYFLALEKGYDPDKPRNLAKSVTVK